MIDFVSLNEDRICLYKGDELVCESRNFLELADEILKNGGPATVIYRSSDWDDSPWREWADYLWDRVCGLI